MTQDEDAPMNLVGMPVDNGEGRVAAQPRRTPTTAVNSLLDGEAIDDATGLGGFIKTIEL